MRLRSRRFRLRLRSRLWLRRSRLWRLRSSRLVEVEVRIEGGVVHVNVGQKLLKRNISSTVILGDVICFRN